MHRAKGGQGDVERTLRGMWRTSRKKEVIPTYPTEGILLATHEERCNRISEEMPRMLDARKLDPYPSIKPKKHGNPMAIPHLGGGFGRASQSSIEWKNLDPSGYKVFHQVDGGNSTW